MAVERDRVGLEALGRLADEGKVRVRVGAVLPLAKAARAHALHERSTPRPCA
jgi:NADPH:quinone reductase-like Zn-dependent oxidoreductase